MLLNTTPNSIPTSPEPIPHNTTSLSSLVLTPTMTLYIKLINAINKITVRIILKISPSFYIRFNITQLAPRNNCIWKIMPPSVFNMHFRILDTFITVQLVKGNDSTRKGNNVIPFLLRFSCLPYKT